MSSPRSTAALELVLLYAAFLLLSLYAAFTQPPITYHDGKGWEGVGYYAVAECFAKGQTPEAEGPFVYRLGTPWLAAKVAPADLFRGFKIVNVIANTLGVALLWLWFRRHISSPVIRVALVLCYLCQWDTPTRWIWFYPLHADPWLYVTLFAGLLLIDHYREKPALGTWAGLCVLSVLGVLNREVALLVPLTLIAVGRPIRGHSQFTLPRWRDWVPLILGLAAFIIVKRSVHQTDSYSFIGTVLDFIYTKGAGGFIHAFFLAFGPVLLVALFDWRRAASFLGERQDLLLYLLVCVAFGYAGGTDTERLLYWGMPVVYVLVGRALEHHRVLFRWAPLLAMLVIGQILTSRVLWTTPDYPHDAPHSFPILQQVGSNVPFLDLFSYHGFHLKEFICLLEWVVFGSVFLWLAARRSEVTNVSPPSRN